MPRASVRRGTNTHDIDCKPRKKHTPSATVELGLAASASPRGDGSAPASSSGNALGSPDGGAESAEDAGTDGAGVLEPGDSMVYAPKAYSTPGATPVGSERPAPVAAPSAETPLVRMSSLVDSLGASIRGIFGADGAEDNPASATSAQQAARSERPQSAGVPPDGGGMRPANPDEVTV